MNWSDMQWCPADRTLRQFAVLWAIFFGMLALWQGVAERVALTFVLAFIAVLGGCLGLVRPSLLRPIYVAWMAAVFPIGWLISHLLLALVYFGIFTPLGWLLRLLGRDALQLRPCRSQSTYWIARSAAYDVRRYFRSY